MKGGLQPPFLHSSVIHPSFSAPFAMASTVRFSVPDHVALEDRSAAAVSIQTDQADV